MQAHKFKQTGTDLGIDRSSAVHAEGPGFEICRLPLKRLQVCQSGKNLVLGPWCVATSGRRPSWLAKRAKPASSTGVQQVSVCKSSACSSGNLGVTLRMAP